MTRFFKNLISLSLFLSIGGHLNSQSISKYFNIFNTPPPQYDGNSKVEILNDGYFVCDIRVTSTGNSDINYFKADFNGNKLWEVWENDPYTVKEIANFTIANNEYVMAGLFDSIPNQRLDAMIMKVDTLGNQIWERHYADSAIEWSRLLDIIHTYDNNYISVGLAQDSIPKFHGYLLKTDTSGNVIYSKTFQNMLNSNCTFYSAVELPNHNIMATGFAELKIDSVKLLLALFDPFGNILFDSTYSFYNRPGTMGYCIANTLDGNVIVCGMNSFGISQGMGLLVKFDYNGNVLWSSRVAEFSDGSGAPAISSYLINVRSMDDSTYLCAGDITLLTNQTLYVSKLNYIMFDKNGNELWRRYYTSNTQFDHYNYDIEFTSDGGFISCGRVFSSNNTDCFLLKANCMGYIDSPIAGFNHTVNNLIATFDVTSSYFEYCTLYFGDGDSAVYSYQDTVPIVHNYLAGGVQSAYMIAYACGESDTVYIPVITGLNDPENVLPLTIQPNPNSGQFTIYFHSTQHQFKQLELSVSDITGKVVYQQQVQPTSDRITIDLTGLVAKGIYVLHLDGEGVRKTGKLVLE